MYVRSPGFDGLLQHRGIFSEEAPFALKSRLCLNHRLTGSCYLDNAVFISQPVFTKPIHLDPKPSNRKLHHYPSRRYGVPAALNKHARWPSELMPPSCWRSRIAMPKHAAIRISTITGGGKKYALELMARARYAARKVAIIERRRLDLCFARDASCHIRIDSAVKETVAARPIPR